MSMWNLYFESLLLMLLMGFVTWLYSLMKKNVSIVDSLWSIFFLAGGAYVYLGSPAVNSKSDLLMLLVSLWALRLAIFMTYRNWGEPEDRRYQEIRRNNSPGFSYKSLFIVFTLQAGIAWIVFIGLLPGIYAGSDFSLLDIFALMVWVTGFAIEVIADWQLYRFKNNSENNGSVLNQGLWRFSRHPNYFGEFLIWWGLFLMIVSVQNWWVITAPVVMTLLLLRVSGVSLMESGITVRRPQYKDYIDTTNTFFPWWPKNLQAPAKKDVGL